MFGVTQLAYLVASALFIFALHWMNTPGHGPERGLGRRGGDVHRGRLHLGAAGDLPPPLDRPGDRRRLPVGVPLSRVPLTAVPQRTALSHAFGGAAAGLVGAAEFYLWAGSKGRST